MQIAGIQKTTLVDYPGKIAATVFLRGCNFRCGFCHNPELVLPEQFLPLLDKEELFTFLESRLGKLQGVCITGGEPLLWGTTRELVSHIKALGYAVKLDTNGSYPERLAEIIADGDLDYIAMDIKSTLDKYPMLINSKIQETPLRSSSYEGQARNKQITNPKSKNTSVIARNGFVTKQSIGPAIGQSNNFSENLTAESSKLKASIFKSIDLIMSSGLDYEFRTTVVKPLHTPDDFIEIGKMIKGAKKFYIQNFVSSKQVSHLLKFAPFTGEELKVALENITPMVELAGVR